jgi:hypothetical protein
MRGRRSAKALCQIRQRCLAQGAGCTFGAEGPRRAVHSIPISGHFFSSRPAGIAIFRVRLRDQVAGIQLAGSAQAVCEKLIGNSQGALWTKAYELFGYLAATSANWRELYKSGQELVGDAGWLLGLALYLTAGLFAAPVDAWRLQLAFLPAFELAYAATEERVRASILGQPRRPYYQSLVCSAVVEFWAANVSDAGFYYRNPRVAQEALQDANALCDVCTRLRNVLMIVASHVDLSPTPQQRSWLESH